MAEKAASYPNETTKHRPTFNDVLEVADALSLPEQEELLDILRKRIIEQR